MCICWKKDIQDRYIYIYVCVMMKVYVYMLEEGHICMLYAYICNIKDTLL